MPKEWMVYITYDLINVPEWWHLSAKADGNSGNIVVHCMWRDIVEQDPVTGTFKADRVTGDEGDRDTDRWSSSRVLDAVQSMSFMNAHAPPAR